MEEKDKTRKVMNLMIIGNAIIWAIVIISVYMTQKPRSVRMFYYQC